jgi:hypothetical protein
MLCHPVSALLTRFFRRSFVSSEEVAIAAVANQTAASPSAAPLGTAETTLFRVLAAVSFCHLLNDMVQSLLPSMYPILKSSFHLDFVQIGIAASSDRAALVRTVGR